MPPSFHGTEARGQQIETGLSGPHLMGSYRHEPLSSPGIPRPSKTGPSLRLPVLARG